MRNFRFHFKDIYFPITFSMTWIWLYKYSQNIFLKQMLLITENHEISQIIASPAKLLLMIWMLAIS